MSATKKGTTEKAAEEKTATCKTISGNLVIKGQMVSDSKAR